MINIPKGQYLQEAEIILLRKKTVLLRIRNNNTLFCIKKILKTIAGKRPTTST
jgi:hypothetical protein